MTNRNKKGSSGNMPSPRTSGAGRGRAIFWAICAVILVGGAYWWMRMEPDERGSLRDAAADKVNKSLEGTPLAGAGDIIRESPPPPPPNVVNPPTEAGTLAGRSINGTIAAPITFGSERPYDGATDASSGNSGISGLPPGVAGGENGATFSSEFMPAATEDATVRSTYLADLAKWLADRYKPGPQGGSLAVDVRNINYLCGVDLAARAKGGRSALLRYAFQPSMIHGLYNLYINQFMGDLDLAAKKRGFDAAKTRDFHQAIAARAAVAANMLDGVMKVPDLGAKLAGIEAASQKAVDINAQLADAVFELDGLREGKASAQQINVAQMRVDGIAARYRRSMNEYSDARQALAAAIRKEMGQPGDEDSLLFMAAWVERRRESGSNAAASLREIHAILQDFAKRCAQK